MIIRIIFLFIQLANALAAENTNPLPCFEDFRVAEVYQGKPAPAQPKSAFANRFRSVIRQGAEKGPNFAGHYTVIVWGCGTSCAEFAIVDALTGRTYDSPFGLITWGDDKGMLKASGLHFRLDSSLFLAQGCPMEKNCAARYYKWNDDHLVLLRTAPVERFPVPHPEPPATTVRP